MMIRKSLKVAFIFAITGLTASVFGVKDVRAAGAHTHVEDYNFSFEGPFGKFDRAQLQRGWQIYSQVCSGCHAMKYLSYRNLTSETGPGFSEEQVKAMIADYVVVDGPNEEGEMFERPATLADHFVSPYPNPEASKAANGGAYPPDLSLMAKARSSFHDGVGVTQFIKGMGGTEYIASLLTGYRDAPECAADAEIGGYYNVAFPAGGIPASCKDEHGKSMVPGSWIAMAPPLSEGVIEYQGENVEASVEQMSQDVAAFLMWAAEPKLVDRKQAGLRNIAFLIIFAVLLWYSNKKIWKPLKSRKE
jgi:ubiquinol-cytochrome c reductase cytochrome c1 subunit